MELCNVGYFGSVSNLYCLDILNELTNILPSNKFQFHICGKVVEGKVSMNPQIRYHGYLSGKSFLSFCNSIDVFINPRCNAEELSSYSFPSKIYEYMSFCRPVISTPIPHVSEGTSYFVNFSRDFSSESIAGILMDLEKNYSFFLSKAQAQRAYLDELDVGKKIHEFLENAI